MGLFHKQLANVVEWEEYRDCWEEFAGRETECVPEYVKYGTK